MWKKNHPVHVINAYIIVYFEMPIKSNIILFASRIRVMQCSIIVHYNVKRMICVYIYVFCIIRVHVFYAAKFFYGPQTFWQNISALQLLLRLFREKLYISLHNCTKTIPITAVINDFSVIIIIIYVYTSIRVLYYNDVK